MNNMVHWTQALKEQIGLEHDKNAQARDIINELRNHLLSSKFHVDSTIQVNDVQSWLDRVVTALMIGD